MRAAAAISLLLVWPCSVSAQANREQLRRAISLFEESEIAYNQGEFNQAASLLRRAYELHPDATLIFNLARALEGAGDLEGAADAYERYLAEADSPPDRAGVEARVRTLREQIEALSHRSGSVEPGESPPPAADPSEPSGEDPGPDIAPWIVTGIGGLVLATGAAMGAVSQDLATRAAVEPVQVEAVALHDDAETFATAANVLFVSGGVIALGGLVWGIVSLTSSGGDADEGGEEPTATLRVGPGAVSVHGTF